MQKLKEKNIIFASSITVTKNNLHETLSDEFVFDLISFGVKAIFFVEYVPFEKTSKNIAIDENDRTFLLHRINILREKFSEILLIAFLGDEKGSNGCLAAGRGFIHINYYGDVEPCPFAYFNTKKGF